MVEGTVIEETGRGARADELAREYKALVIAMLQNRGAWQVVDSIQQLEDPSVIADRSGYAAYLNAAQSSRSSRPRTSWSGSSWSSGGPRSTWPS